MSKDIAIDYHPTPLIRHQVSEINPDIAETMRAAKSAATPKAPSAVFPEIQLGPALLQEDFTVPSDIVESTQQGSRKRSAETGQVEGEVPTKRQTRSSTRSKNKGKGKSSSTSVAPTIPVSIPLASTSQAPSIAVVPSGPP